MQRAEQIDLIHLQHMSWQDDCLVVKIHKSKKDQAGEGEQGSICTGRHVFACPSSPEICPICVGMMPVDATTLRIPMKVAVSSLKLSKPF